MLCELPVSGTGSRSAAVQDGVMTRRLALPLLAVVAGLTAACGSEKVDVSDQPAGGVSYPTGADQAVVRLSTGGGFVPEGADFRTPPELLIMGDGTVYLPGAQIEIYPGAAPAGDHDGDPRPGRPPRRPRRRRQGRPAEGAAVLRARVRRGPGGRRADDQPGDPRQRPDLRPPGVRARLPAQRRRVHAAAQRPRPLRDAAEGPHGPGRGGAPDRGRGLHAGALRCHRPRGDPRGAGADAGPDHPRGRRRGPTPPRPSRR